MYSKVQQLLGLTSRARKNVSGETLFHKLRQQEVSLVIVAEDASQNSIKKISDKCTYYNVEYIVYGTISEISNAIGKENRVAVGILDKGFSKKIKEEIGG
ncbi:MAG: L7Ae/L30e/S12e/Gadd45 family ribosomal protein [Coprobacillaceae bacterium]